MFNSTTTKLLSSALLVCLTSSNIKPQDLVFEDEQLKALLITENCVNFDGDFSYEEDVDTNDDLEISLEEALQVQDLRVTDSSDQYNISSVNDLQFFSNLRKLTMWGHNYLSSFNGLTLDSLAYLHLDACNSLEHIDISTLVHVDHLRIEDFNGIEYLNIQNGSAASENFSLFYTHSIAYACVDSIAAEYDLVHSAMAIGNSPSVFCEPNGISEENFDRKFIVYPNPAYDLIEFHGEYPIDEIRILNLQGRVIPFEKPQRTKMDISHLKVGTYIIEIYSEENRITKLISKN